MYLCPVICISLNSHEMNFIPPSTETVKEQAQSIEEEKPTDSCSLYIHSHSTLILPLDFFGKIRQKQSGNHLGLIEQLIGGLHQIEPAAVAR